MADPPSGLQREYSLSRLTTIRTGGPAEFFARVGAIDQLEELMAWAGGEQIEVGVVGSGSNLLVADAGVRGLVVKLDKELAEIELGGHPHPMRRRRPPARGVGAGGPGRA